MFKYDQLDKGFILRVSPSAIDLAEELKRIVKYGPRDIDYLEQELMDDVTAHNNKPSYSSATHERQTTSMSAAMDSAALGAHADNNLKDSSINEDANQKKKSKKEKKDKKKQKKSKAQRELDKEEEEKQIESMIEHKLNTRF